MSAIGNCNFFEKILIRIRYRAMRGKHLFVKKILEGINKYEK